MLPTILSSIFTTSVHIPSIGDWNVFCWLVQHVDFVRLISAVSDLCMFLPCFVIDAITYVWIWKDFYTLPMVHSLWLDAAIFFQNFCNCLSVFTIPTSTEEWKVTVPKKLDALVDSCVVIPCSFTHPQENLPTPRLKATWYLSNNPDHHVYCEEAEEVMEKFKDRTKLLGPLGQNNCTLEIVDIKDYDNGPFCLQIEILQEEDQTGPTDSKSFVDSCVQFKIRRMLLNIQNFIDIFQIWSTHQSYMISFYFYFVLYSRSAQTYSHSAKSGLRGSVLHPHLFGHPHVPRPLSHAEPHVE